VKKQRPRINDKVEMPKQLEIGDAIAAMKDWQLYLDTWLADLRKAKQPTPTDEQIQSLREVWGEGYLIGRLSK
jgi:hypothetical protein